MRFVLVALAILVLACEGGPTPPINPSDETVALDDVCANIRKIGCPEGEPALGGTPCTITLKRALAMRPLPIACWADARDVAELRACGSIRCVR